MRSFWLRPPFCCRSGPWWWACLLVLAETSPGLEALDWQLGPAHRSAPVVPAGAGKTGFSLLPPGVTGVHFTNSLSEQRHLTNQILLNGSGVALGDVDGDGLTDLYLCRLDGPNALYRNRGDWKFEEMAERAGVALPELDATGAALADLDGDRDLDLIVNSVGGGTHVFLNDGSGKFTPKARLNESRSGTSLALGDVDGDGLLDVYIANYRTSGLMDMPNARANFRTVNGRTVLDRLNGRPLTDPDLTNRFFINARGAIEELGEVDSFYRNAGGGEFALVSFTGGRFLDEEGRALATPLFEWGLAAMFRDVNDDTHPDLYVCNDFASADRFWVNQGNGTFRLLPRLALRHTSHFSMGVDFADIDRDGFDDFHVLDMLSRDHRQRMMQEASLPVMPSAEDPVDRPQYGFNTLLLNRGDGSYAEIAQLSRVDAAEWAWCPVFLDVDLDGFEDLLVSNGQERAARDKDVTERLRRLRAIKRMTDAEIFQERRAFPRYATANVAFRNRGDLTFEECGATWGFDLRGVSHGMALGDLDNDGDLDLVVNNLNSAVAVYRNDTPAARVAVRLKGLAPNTRGIGTKVWLRGGAVPVQSQEMICGGRYLSSDDPVRTFAAGALTNEMQIEVRWRSGRRTLVTGVKGNRIYEIDEAGATDAGASGAGGKERSSPHPALRTPHFEDVSHLLNHVHRDELYDDLARQPMLPRSYGQLGPGVAWFDADGNGFDDLIIGAGKGGEMAVFANDGNGGFRSQSGPLIAQKVTRDQNAVLGWNHAGAAFILAGAANYEDGLTAGASVRRITLSKSGLGRIEDGISGSSSSTGPLAMADLDDDGDLDLFVGGRILAGRYPEAAASRLFRNDDGALVLDAEKSRVLEKGGLVSGAVFSDLTGDGTPELLLACEWGPIKVFRFGGGTPREITQELGLDRYVGWWNGVAAGDFDGDGRMDIVASNWGRNTPYEAHRSGHGRTLRLYYGDLDGDGTVEVLEAHHEPARDQDVPDRPLDITGRALPWLRERMGTHQAYGEATLEEILGPAKAGKLAVLGANWLESTLFLNRGDRFEPRTLPIEAQFAPAFGVCVADMNGDGYEDVFLSQNFFAVRPEDARCDAGWGLWLRGDGKGGFAAMSGLESGVQVEGEQRGCAVSDYDGDGRVDLVVAQNRAATRLFRNRGAKPGLRVRLRGPARNSSGIGAQIRLRFGGRSGPIRELHAGSGYGSQDGAVAVMAGAEPPTDIDVRWPGGRTTTAKIPSNAREISLDPTGALEVLK